MEVESDWQGEFNPDIGQSNYRAPDVELGITGCDADVFIDKGKIRKVLSIVIDGMRPDAMLVAETPTFDQLMATGLFSLEART